MKYCGSHACQSTMWYHDAEMFCRSCGKELTPEINCLCGYNSFNPKSNLPAFCSHCGAALTEAYLGQCMAAQLRGMVQEIAKKQAAFPPIEVV